MASYTDEEIMDMAYDAFKEGKSEDHAPFMEGTRCYNLWCSSLNYCYDNLSLDECEEEEE